MKKILVTGGAGFVGSHFVDLALREGLDVVVLDALTYAAHPENLRRALQSGHCELIQGDIRNREDLGPLFENHALDAVLNFAAESHVDRSIEAPADFITTHLQGTFELLRHSLTYWEGLSGEARGRFRFLQVSTDEVFGSLGNEGKFTESSPYHPSSPYSASKAGADHLVDAWHRTYGLPTIITHSTNNYGPRQHPEKLIPQLISRALRSESLRLFGNGMNVRDWIHVEDHCRGILLALQRGKPGSHYGFGGNCEKSNLALAQEICRLLDQLEPRRDGQLYEALIQFVKDRKGHDWRYAFDDSRAQKELGYTREVEDFQEGLFQTLRWYLENRERLAES